MGAPAAAKNIAEIAEKSADSDSGLSESQGGLTAFGGGDHDRP
jgi:hypothetical protein